MITVSTEGNKCFLHHTEGNSGFILDSDQMDISDLVNLYLWAYSKVDEKGQECENCHL